MGEFWSFGTHFANTIPCDKNRLFCHARVTGDSAKHVDFAQRSFQHPSNSRFSGTSQNSLHHPERKVGIEEMTNDQISATNG